MARSESPFRRQLRLFHELQQVRRFIRNWFGVSLAGYAYKFLPLPPREISVVMRNGSKMRVPMRRNAGALYPILEVFTAGEYEYDWHLETEPMVLDIGAHIGSFIVWLAERNPRLRGIAYEPDPAAREYLLTNLRANGLDRVEVRSQAVSDRAGEAQLFRPDPGGAISSLHRPSSTTVDAVPTTVVAFDDVVAQVAGDISLLKLDCEGAEFEIVLGSKPDSWRRIKRVVLEYHPVDSANPTTLIRRFETLGFKCVKGGDRLQSVGTLWLERTKASSA